MDSIHIDEGDKLIIYNGVTTEPSLILKEFRGKVESVNTTNKVLHTSSSSITVNFQSTTFIGSWARGFILSYYSGMKTIIAVGYTDLIYK